MPRIALLALATTAALAATGTVRAHDVDGCIDAACHLTALYADDGASGAGSALVAAQRMGTWGIDVAGMDKTIDPGADFYGYVNGTWARTTVIPPDRSSFGSFLKLRDLSEARVRALVESYPADDLASGSDAAKVGALYRGFLDEAAIEARGAAPLKALLDPVREARDKEAIAAGMARAQGGFGRTLFGSFVGDDAKDPNRYTLYMGQGGLGLGDRQMYIEEKFAPQRARYEQYIAQMLTLAGWPKPAENAKAILAFETRIANAHWTRADSRDRDKTYNPVTPAELAALAPGFPWQRFLVEAGIDGAPRMVLRQNTAFAPMAKAFAETDLDTLKAYKAFSIADTAAPLLPKAFVDAEFEFRSKFLSGQPEQRERWKRGVAFVEAAMGEAIGRDYVELYFPADAKAKMDSLVSNVKAAMRTRLEQLDWMGPATRAEALSKLDGFGLKIGYPEKWRDYSGLKVVAGDTFGNAQRAQRFEWDFDRARIGQPVDKGEWGMTPQTVNAYYNSVKNEIVFPAAILQPPFFDPDADPAVNYGAIGGVIGHEIIHGFDDQGRKSDGAGVLRDWWTAEDAAKFEAQAAKLGAQYEAFEFPQLPGMRINGRVSMGENIGDLGGLVIALEAYRRSLGGKPASVIDGFTGEQRLFMGWAQVWRTMWRDDALRQQLVNGTHSPGQIRAFAPLRNIDAWYEAFNVTKDDPLYIAPADRVRIW